MKPAARIGMLCGLRPAGWTPPRPGIYKIPPTSDVPREIFSAAERLERQRVAQDEALRLRREGVPYPEIAARLGYADGKTAYAAAQRAMARSGAA
jgi:hypothetical protein